MVRVIDQTEYDDLVSVNYVERHMTVPQAVASALAQFEAEGADLSNVDQLPFQPNYDLVIRSIIKKLKELCAGNHYNIDAVTTELEALKTECTDDYVKRTIAGSEGVYTILLRLLRSKQTKLDQKMNEKDAKFFELVLQTLVVIMDDQPRLLDLKGAETIKIILEKADNDDILLPTLQWTAQCATNNKKNQRNLVAQNIHVNLKNIINENGNEQIIRETLKVIRRLTQDFAVKYEFAKELVQAKVVGPVVAEPIKNLLKKSLDSDIVAEILLSLSCVVVTDEVRAMVGDCCLFDVLTKYYDDPITVQQISTLISFLAINAEVKRDFVRKGITSILVCLLNSYAGYAATSATLIKAISALTFEEANHSQMFFDRGVADSIVTIMNTHNENYALQQYACAAIRNMIARNSDQKLKYLQLGIEPILNYNLVSFKGESVKEFKATLVDLGCPVQMEP